MNLRKISLMAAAVAAAVGCSKVEQRPNIVVLYIDDLDFEELGYMGGKVHTPFIDSLASQSLQLTNYYVASPVSTPSRYSSLTGRYASNSSSFAQHDKADPAYIRWNADIVENLDVTIPTYLNEANYYSGMVGKWHNGQPIKESKLSEITMQSADLNAKIAEVYEQQRSYVERNSGFDYAESIYANNLHAIGLPEEMQLHNMEWVTKGALDFLSGCSGERPFFLWFSTTVPHTPNAIASLQGDARITAQGVMDKPIEGVQPSREDVLRRTRKLGIDDSHAGMLWLDDGIRALFAKLQEMDVLDNTIVIFASDNGESQGKMTCYQAAAHLPAFVYWRGKIAPAKVDELTSNIDILPTLLEISGAEQTALELDGESWVDMIFEQKPLKREALYCEIVYQRAVITKDWKYIATRFPRSTAEGVSAQNRQNYSIEGIEAKDRYRNDLHYPAYYDDDQLYDLRTDYNEQTNLYHDANHTDEVKRMRELMQRFVATVPFDFGEYRGRGRMAE